MKYLKKVTSPDDLKKLSLPKLEMVCAELRKFLVESVSKTGGHLASNLGVVELTVALHYCFDSPRDKMIWDVGHQAYIHKMLTGRLDRFSSLRKWGGLSGFPKSSESPHDVFDTGHSSTSVSAALGFCVARDLLKEEYSVISIIGDGSLTGGLALEALNNAGRANTNLIVVVNDNQMSIGENVGALSKHLNEIRTAPGYLDAKEDIHNLLHKIPVVGKSLDTFIGKSKDSLKYLLVPGVFFEELGFKYVGPIDGHNLKELISVLNKAKNMTGPVLLHVSTVKGKGYANAENAPDAFHGVDSFDVTTGQPVKTKIWGTYSDVFSRSLMRLAEKNEKIVAVTAAMAAGTGVAAMAKRFPERVFDVGIAESHAVTFAAGLAKNGLIPVVAIYSSFLQRAYDQILHDVCLQNLPVIFAIDRAGLVGSDGETHQGLFDLSYLSHIPHITIMAPKNKNELIQMMEFAVLRRAPVAIRFPRGAASLALKDLDTPIQLGKSETIFQGEELAIVSVGTMMDVALEVYKRLRIKGKSPALINARFVKPLDLEMVKSLLQYRYVFILEDGIRAGGFGSRVLEEVALLGVSEWKTQFCSIAFPDTFVEQGDVDQLYQKYGLDVAGVYDKIIAVTGLEDR